MPRRIAITSDKGGVGKSTLALHLAGAWAARGQDVLLVDQDGRVGSCLRWAARGRLHGRPALGFTVLPPDELKRARLRQADVVIVDSEGRPRRKDLRRLAADADLLLVPSGVSPLELEATLEVVGYLNEQTDAGRHTRAVLTRVPAVGRAGQEAREDLREAGLVVCNTLIRQAAPFVRAAEVGSLVRDLPGPSAARAWATVLALAQEVGERG